MKLWLTLASILLWCFIAWVKTRKTNQRIFLEIVIPTVDTTELVGKLINRAVSEETADASQSKGVEYPAGLPGEGRYTVVLYQCMDDNRDNIPGYRVTCNPIYEGVERYQVYATTLFTAVTDLKLPGDNVVNLGRDTIRNAFPQALAIGFDPHNYYRPHFEPSLPDTSLVKKEVYRFLGPLLRSENTSTVEVILRLYSINTVRWFYGKKAESPVLFTAYTALLQKVINASGYSKKLDSQTPKSGPPSRSPSRSWSSLCQSFFRSRSPSRQKSQSRSISWPFRSRSGSGKKFPSPPPSPSQFKSNSQPDPEESVVLSPSRPKSLSNADILRAASYLTFKMFDPCFIQWMNQLDLKSAEYYCMIQCQFVSATTQVYRRGNFSECRNFTIGKCVEKMCECAQRPRVGEVNMADCNNSIRLHIYKTLSKLSPNEITPLE